MAAFTENEMKDFKITDWYDLSGQVAVVTGGSTGLGLAITRCLVSAGAKVCVVSFESRQRRWKDLGIERYSISLTSRIQAVPRNWWTGLCKSRGVWTSWSTMQETIARNSSGT